MADYTPVRTTNPEQDGDIRFHPELEHSAEGHIEYIAVSKFRRALPQILAVTAKNFMYLTFASIHVLPAIMIPSLLAARDSPIADKYLHLNKDQMSWYASTDSILIATFSLFSGWLTRPFGPRTCMMAVCIPIVIAWVLLHYAYNIQMLYFSAVISAIGHGIVESSVTAYVGEVCEPHLRGTLAACNTLVYYLGFLIQFAVANFIPWRTMTLVNIAIPVTAFVSLYFVPESPIFLIGNGRMKEAEASLCWLRGWVPCYAVQKEMAEIRMVLNHPTRLSRPWSAYRHRTFVLPLILLGVSEIFGGLSGIQTLRTYSIVNFQLLGSPFSAHFSAMLCSGAQVVGCIICIIIIPYTGKRLSVLTMAPMVAAIYAITGVYARYVELGHNMADYKWLPLTCLTIANVLCTSGIYSLRVILRTEIFPVHLRSVAAGICLSFYHTISSVSIKTYFNLLDTLQLSGIFFLYSSFLLLTALFYFYFLPETEGRTLFEIEQHIAGITNLTRDCNKTKGETAGHVV